MARANVNVNTASTIAKTKIQSFKYKKKDLSLKYFFAGWTLERVLWNLLISWNPGRFWTFTYCAWKGRWIYYIRPCYGRYDNSHYCRDCHRKLRGIQISKMFWRIHRFSRIRNYWSIYNNIDMPKMKYIHIFTLRKSMSFK